MVFALTLTSGDLNSVHTSEHEVYGGPRDSGRAEMTGVVINIYYLTELIQYMDLREHRPIEL